LNDQNELPEQVIGIVMGLALGLSIGTGQYFVLRQRLARARRWVAVSAVAYLIGLGLGFPLLDGNEFLGLAFIGLAPMSLTWLGMGQLWQMGEAPAGSKIFRWLLWGGAALSLVILLIGALVVTNGQKAELLPIPPTVDPQQHLIFHNGCC
jgi:hypothetical protein